MVDASLSVNKGAYRVAEEAVANAEVLGIEVYTVDCGATVIDFGVGVRGSVRSGILFARACMGDLAQVSMFSIDYDGLVLPAVHVSSDNPTVATIGAQYGDWELQIQGFPVIGSGPARALALNRRMPAAVASKRDAYEEAGYVINSPPEIYEKIGYRDFSDVAVIALESPVLPTNETLQGIAEQCGVEPRRLYAIVAPTSSIVGSVQVAARVLEVGIHKLGLLGFDLKKIVSGSAYSAIAPVHPDSDEAMGRTNDMIWYGGVTFYTVECDDEDVRRIISRIPAEASKDYDKGFAEIFRGARHGFYDVDLGSFAPAIVTINNARTGSTFTAGRVNPEALRRMLIS